jgi:predicted RNase H-like HicB family nuclease
MRKGIIQFRIYRGEKYYVAECLDLPIVTQGKTLDEVIENIKEAIELHLEGEDLEELGISPHFSVLINMELDLVPVISY